MSLKRHIFLRITHSKLKLYQAKKIDEEKFLKYIRENFWLDKKTIEMELKRLEKEMNEENFK